METIENILLIIAFLLVFGFLLVWRRMYDIKEELEEQTTLLHRIETDLWDWWFIAHRFLTLSVYEKDNQDSENGTAEEDEDET